MMLKRKIEMTLPQLIESIWQNDVRDRKFRSSESSIGGSVFVSETGSLSIKKGVVKTDTFIVEVEEEITEHTVFPKLVTRNTSGRYNRWIDECVKGFHLELIEAIYILNDDMTMTLIWTNEKGLLK